MHLRAGRGGGGAEGTRGASVALFAFAFLPGVAHAGNSTPPTDSVPAEISPRSGGSERADGPAHADGGVRAVSLVAEVSCDPLPGPGKVQCLIRVRPVGGALRWSDAIVVAAPTFAPPLRTRVAVGDAKRNDADGAEFSLALAATADGVGELKVVARATVCGDGGCRPVQADGVAKVVVGAPGPRS